MGWSFHRLFDGLMRWLIDILSSFCARSSLLMLLKSLSGIHSILEWIAQAFPAIWTLFGLQCEQLVIVHDRARHQSFIPGENTARDVISDYHKKLAQERSDHSIGRRRFGEWLHKNFPIARKGSRKNMISGTLEDLKTNLYQSLLTQQAEDVKLD
jgi:hypothetical protein